jgi:hypothetical protein
LARALASCTSLRFLELGFPVVGSMPIQDLLALLAALPIELLSIRITSILASIDNSDDFGSSVFDGLRLLPNLLAVITEFDSMFNDYKYKIPHVVVWGLQHYTLWPPAYQQLPPEAPVFRYRPYRQSYTSFLDA